MSYRLIYIVPFASLRNETCVVEIEKEGYTGAPVELTGADSPFTVDIEDEEFLYTPTRFSTARIRVVGSDYLQTLFSTAYQQYRVTFKRSGVVTWCGFVKPEIYTQDYASDIFELEIECTSALSVLEYVNYKSEVEGKRKFVTLWDLVKKCVSSANGKYEAVYIPHVYASSSADYAAGTNVLESMTISEQNFYDEDDKAMTLKEVLEEICKFLNWTVCDWRGSLYFIDMDHEGEYFRYNLGLNSKTKVAINSLNIQRVGFAGGSQLYDGLNGYNKVTVKDSNYSVGKIIPEEDFDDLKKLDVYDKVSENGKQACRRISFIPEKWNMYLYDGDKVVENSDLPSYGNTADLLEGGILLKYCTYNRRKDENNEWVPDITDYSYTNVIQVRFPKTVRPPGGLKGFRKIMLFKGASAVYSDSAIAVSCQFKALKDESLTPWGDSDGVGHDIACQIRIGDKYYGNVHGDTFYACKWESNPANYITLTTHSDSKDWKEVDNKKTLSMPYSGLSGFIFPIAGVLSGELEFTLFSRMDDPNTGLIKTKGLLIKDFKVIIQKKDFADKTDDDTDRYYENVINEDYINELDEIEFKISSYNNDGACYSKVMLLDKYLTNNLYASIVGELIRPEELLIRRIVNRYDATRTKLTQEIQETADLTPITRLSDNFMVNRIFINAGGSIDYKMGQFRCIMIEL